MSSNEQAVEVVITAPDAEWLRSFLQDLVRRRLCAAGHLTHHETIYHWQGEISEGPEVRATLYTRASLVSAIVEATRQQHPYEVPHVSATLISDGNPGYLQWILATTSNALRF